MGSRLFVDIPRVVYPRLSFEVSLIEVSNIVVDAAFEFLKYPLVNLIVCLLNPSLRSRAGSKAVGGVNCFGLVSATRSNTARHISTSGALLTTSSARLKFNGKSTGLYGGPGQRSPDYSAFGQITGLCPCQLQAPNASWLAWQRAVQGVIPIFIVGLSVYALF
jgi:hypothetical protein